MRNISIRLFSWVCIGFSLLMMLMSLICRVEILHAESNIAELERKICDAEKSAELMAVKLENRISLAVIEQRALGELGMQRPTAEQMFFAALE